MTESAGSMPSIDHINYSPPFQAPLPIDTPPEFYSALSKFANLLKRPELRFEHTLKEGEAVIFDNRRSLHARDAFEEWGEHERPRDSPTVAEGESSRWLKGCYLEADAIFDRMRMLRDEIEPITRA